MANLNIYPLEDNYESKLSQPYDGTSSIIYVDSIPTATLPGGFEVLVTINPLTSFAQVVKINGWSAGQLNVSSTTVEKANGVNYTTRSHGAKSPIIISDNFAYWKPIATAVNSKADTDVDVTFQKKVSFSGTDTAGLNVKSLTTTQRDALTPVVGDKIINTTLGVEQTYISGAWQDSGPGATTPNASTTVAGKVEKSTPAQVTAGTSTGETGAELFVGPAELKTVTDGINTAITSNVPEALVDKDTYILGEDCLVNDSLFPEKAPTLAESTLVQNIGDVTANTRVSIIGFGSGVSGNTMQLALRKFVSPSADLAIRLETVDGSGNPTGTLVNANATATVTSASLTTSLVNITVTFAGSFTITLGQRYAIVLNQVGNVVNATNYYGIGTTTRNTTTRRTKLWNGTTRSNITYTNVTDSFTGLSSGFANSLTFVMVLRPKYDMNLVSQTVAFTVTGGGINTNSLTPGVLLQRGISYTFTFTNTVGWFNSGAFAPAAFDVISIPGNFWLAYSIVTTRLDEVFTYSNSTLSIPTLLSKTDARYSYKLPTDFQRIANEAKSAGQNVITSYYGLKGGFTGLSPVTYYASDTPGLISATPGTNPYIIGNAIDGTTLNINGKSLNKGITVSESPFSYTNTTGKAIQVKIIGGTVNPIVVNGVTVATATGIIDTLPAGAVMTVTYTVLPTITYSDL